VDTAYVRKLFDVLYDEVPALPAILAGEMSPQDLPCGSCWVIAVSFHEVVYFKEGDNWMQDWGFTMKMRDTLRGESS